MDSVPTSRKPEDKHSGRAPHARNEQEFLERQSAEARLAMGRAFSDLKSNLKEAVSPSAWVEEHPWGTVAASAAAGLAAGYLITPARGETVREKWREIKNRLSSAKDEEGKDAAGEPEKRQRSILGALAGVVLTGGLKVLSSTVRTVLTEVREAEVAASVNGREEVASGASHGA